MRRRGKKKWHKNLFGLFNVIYSEGFVGNIFLNEFKLICLHMVELVQVLLSNSIYHSFVFTHFKYFQV